MEISSANLGKPPRCSPYWQELVHQKGDPGDWPRRYSFRVIYSFIYELRQVHIADLYAAMVHSEVVHYGSYRTTSFRTIRDLFK